MRRTKFSVADVIFYQSTGIVQNDNWSVQVMAHLTTTMPTQQCSVHYGFATKHYCIDFVQMHQVKNVSINTLDQFFNEALLLEAAIGLEP